MNLAGLAMNSQSNGQDPESPGLSKRYKYLLKLNPHSRRKTLLPPTQYSCLMFPDLTFLEKRECRLTSKNYRRTRGICPYPASNYRLLFTGGGCLSTKECIYLKYRLFLRVFWWKTDYRHGVCLTTAGVATGFYSGGNSKKGVMCV